MQIDTGAYDQIASVGIAMFSMDRDQDGKLTFVEFVANVYPALNG